MKKTFYILIISMFLFVGCDNQKNILDKEKDLKEEIKLLNSYDNIDITSEKKLNESNDYSFSILGYFDSINPAHTRVQSEENTNEANINLANIINLNIKRNTEEIVEKIVIRDMDIIVSPNIGKLKFYAIFEGDNNSYLDYMRANEIKDEFKYEKDLVGNSKSFDEFNLMFSATIENILKTSYDGLNLDTYLDILKNNNITKEELKINFNFNVLIYTNQGIYGLPLTYNNYHLKIEDSISKNVMFEEPLYFIKLK